MAQPGTDPSLPPRLGAGRALALSLAVVVGSGIFVLPAWIAALQPSPAAYLAVWGAGMLVALCLASCYAELATVLPRTGGYVVYLREVWGKPVATVYGWAAMAVLYPASLAGLARVFGRSVADLPGVGGGATAWALLLLVAAVGLNLRGAGLSARVQTALVVAKVGLLVGLGAWGLMAAAPVPTEPVAVDPPATGLAAWFLGLVGVMWCFEGFLEVVVVAGELRRPARDLWRTLVGSVLLVGSVYLLFNLALLHQLGTAGMAGRDAVAADLAALLAGPGGRVVVDLAVAVATGSAVVGLLLSGPRILLSMAREGEFFAGAASVGVRWRSPWVAVLLLGAAASSYVVVASFEQLVKFFSFSTGLFSLLILLAGARLRLAGRVPAVSRRIPLWPLPLVIAVVATAGMVAYSFADQPRASLAGLAVVALALPAVAWRRQRGRR